MGTMDDAANRILSVFLEDPSAPRYGLTLMQRTRMGTGTLYPALARLERAGWLRTYKEADAAVTAKRPARRCYELTPEGLAAIRAEAPER